MNVDVRIDLLRKKMEKNDISVYIIPTADYHGSEYIHDYFDCRKYMSGFTGSAGTMIVTMDEAVLYTDGRYFIQAERELAGSSIKLMKMGEKNTISIKEYINRNIGEKKLGFDGKVMQAREVIEYEKSYMVCSDLDLVGEIWNGRNKLIGKDIFILEESYAGETAGNKLNRIRNKMIEYKADVHILTSLDDIAWLYNIRGNDIQYNPVVFAYTIITSEKTIIYLMKEAISKTISEYFTGINVEIKTYEEFYEDIKALSGNILIEKGKINYNIWKKINSNNIIDKENPTTLMKAIKNDTEIRNLRKAHVMDGVAVTKFIYWLKNEINKGSHITEMLAAEKLEEYRSVYKTYVCPSFATISAYESNAAMMHYSADENSNAVLEKKGFLLVDSGGQYYEGTTDITRTVVLGDISDEAKKHYTLVTKSMLSLANATFLYGCKGINLDILAREPLWNVLMDYKCGTGHGVGYMLNVHEAPNGFRWRSIAERNDGCVLEPGMITTDEPGVYIEGQYGIRIENELLCVEKCTNEYGTFLGFEQLTMAPIDLEAIDTKYLENSDINNLNIYHQMVYNTIAPFLEEDVKKWLKEYTRAL
ncbi:MAG: aminopeptidase P family protein [Lachnospiraceae bacterium]|nr:aminopeptidase P family protein [Lachnospiraceae bacterium]